MGRRSRIHYPGAVYHAMARGVDGRYIFIDDKDRNGFLNALERIKRETAVDLYAYCLMNNHFHMAIKVGQIPLAAVMQRILTSYSLTFNNRHDRTGHLFQARYKSILCLDDSYLIGLIRYIHMNPVRAGLVLRPEDWAWSSHRSYQETRRDGSMGADGDLPDFDPWPQNTADDQISLTQIPATRKQSLTSIADKISSEAGISATELRSGSRRRNIVSAKRLLAQEAVRDGHRLIAIARWLRLTPGAMTRYLRENTANK